MRCVALLLMLAVVGACTAPRAVTPASGASAFTLELRAGDTVRIVTTQRQRYTLKISEIGPAELAGVTQKPRKHETSRAGVPVFVPYADLAMVEVRRFSGRRTAALVAIPVVVAGVSVVATEAGASAGIAGL